MSAYHKKQNQDSSSKPQYKLGKKKKNMKQAHRPFYASTPRKKLSEKRNPENEIKGIYKQMEG